MYTILVDMGWGRGIQISVLDIMIYQRGGWRFEPHSDHPRKS